MLAGNALQSGYSIINMIWVGNIVGENGLGATAISFPIMFILIGLGAGATMATSVLSITGPRITKGLRGSLTIRSPSASCSAWC